MYMNLYSPTYFGNKHTHTQRETDRQTDRQLQANRQTYNMCAR